MRTIYQKTNPVTKAVLTIYDDGSAKETFTDGSEKVVEITPQMKEVINDAIRMKLIYEKDEVEETPIDTFVEADGTKWEIYEDGDHRISHPGRPSSGTRLPSVTLTKRIAFLYGLMTPTSKAKLKALQP